MSLKRPETFSDGGWNGCLEKKPGWGTSSLSSEWVSPKRQEMFFINTLRQTQLWSLTSKWLNLSLRIVTSKRLERFLRRLLSIWVQKQLKSRTSYNSVSSRLNSTSTKEHVRF